MNAFQTQFADPRGMSMRVPLNLSRRGFLGASLGAFVLGIAMPVRLARAEEGAPEIKPGTRVPAFLEIRADGSVLLRNPFVEGGQGIDTAMAQIVGEELDADPATFEVEVAPPGADYQVIGGMRLTGASFSVRTSYDTMRRLGASARHMLLAAAADELDVPPDELTTEPGRVLHAASGRSIGYGDLAEAAAVQEVPEDVTLRDKADFRWIGKPVERIDVRAKSTGRATYAIDLKVDDMLQAAVQHAPRLGMEPDGIANQSDIEAMPGVHSVHSLPGAVAVVADRWWRARKAVEALEVTWRDPEPGTDNAMPADFSSEGLRSILIDAEGPGFAAEEEGDLDAALSDAERVVEAVYDAPFLAHGQLEPPSAIARFNADGTLDLWAQNQQPDVFQAVAAGIAGVEPHQVNLHSPTLGGFFGRHFLYGPGNPFPQAILLAKAVGRPVKVIWSREEEFLRDALRPLGVARFRAGLDADGIPVALNAEAVGEGPFGRWVYRQPEAADSSAVEGLAGKPYGIAARRISHVHVPIPAAIGFWRSVGHSMNDFFYETFLDEVADTGGNDPFDLRMRLLADKPRNRNLLEAVAELSGGWKRGPFEAGDGNMHARGLALASAFNSEVATIAEVSIERGEVVVHDVWVAIDPGSIVNPAIIEAQMKSSVAQGLSAALLEEVVYRDGMPQARNFDTYPILPPHRMPRVHVRIVESGETMGGIGEPGLPGISPAIANALAALTGQRIRTLPLSKHDFSETG